MSKEKVDGVPIDNLLYTKESKESEEKTKAELDLPDPVSDKALGVLNKENQDEQKVD